METGTIVGGVILGGIALFCFVLSVLQFCEKGFLFHNAYLYASKQERETMEKKPYYRQSGTVFACIGLIFAVNVVEVLLQTNWIIYLVLVLVVTVIVYAIVSTVQIEKRKSHS